MAHGRIRVFMGVDNAGRPMYKQISGNTQDERNDNVVKAYIQSGRIWEFMSIPVSYSSMQKKEKKLHLYEEVAAEWFEFSKSRTEEGTQSGNGSYLKHSTEYFKNTPIGGIQVRHIQEFLNTRVDKDEEFLAKGTIRNIWNIVKQVFDYAIAQGYVSSNPARNNILRNPSEKENKRIALNNAELLEIRTAIPSLEKKDERLYMWMLTSMPYRRGEAFGQKWEDIDFDNGTASVTGTVTVVGGRAKYRKKAKNESSLRTMIAQQYFLDSMQEYRKESGYVLNRNGKHYTSSKMDSMWDSIKEQIPLIAEKGLTPHNFRHTVASIMYHESNDIISVAAQCGHTDGGRTTQKTYIHDDMDSRRNAVKMMENGLSRPA